MKGRGHSRSFFYEKEKSELRALPRDQYELSYFKVAKVHPDCHIQHLRNFYSVPYKYVGREVEVKYNGSMIHIYYETKRIASHSIVKGHTHYQTNPAHYPEDKIVEINYHLSQARVQAKRIGSNMVYLIEKLIKMDRFPLKTLRKVQGVLGLSKMFECEALDYAAGLSLEHDRLTYQGVKSFAKNYKYIEEKRFEAPQRDFDLICLQGGRSE